MSNRTHSSSTQGTEESDNNSSFSDAVDKSNCEDLKEEEHEENEVENEKEESELEKSGKSEQQESEEEDEAMDGSDADSESEDVQTAPKVSKTKAGAKAVAPNATYIKPPPRLKYVEMIVVIVTDLQAPRVGVSLQNIKKAFQNQYGINSARSDGYIKEAIKQCVLNGSIVQITGSGAAGSFKLAKPLPASNTAVRPTVGRPKITAKTVKVKAATREDHKPQVSAKEISKSKSAARKAKTVYPKSANASSESSSAKESPPERKAATKKVTKTNFSTKSTAATKTASTARPKPALRAARYPVAETRPNVAKSPIQRRLAPGKSSAKAIAKSPARSQSKSPAKSSATTKAAAANSKAREMKLAVKSPGKNETGPSPAKRKEAAAKEHSKSTAAPVKSKATGKQGPASKKKTRK